MVEYSGSIVTPSRRVLAAVKDLARLGFEVALHTKSSFCHCFTRSGSRSAVTPYRRRS